MKVNVLFFGATAEMIGERAVEMVLRDGIDAASTLEAIMSAFPALSANHDEKSLHLSINQEYSSGNEVIKDGDELAVFTAVSGG